MNVMDAVNMVGATGGLPVFVCGGDEQSRRQFSSAVATVLCDGDERDVREMPIPGADRINAEQLRGALEFLSIPPSGRGRRVAVFHEIDRCQVLEGLLKTLEDPPGHRGGYPCIILSAPTALHVPSTITSRCLRVFLPSAPHVATRREQAIVSDVRRGKVLRHDYRADRQAVSGALRILVSDPSCGLSAARGLSMLESGMKPERVLVYVALKMR